MTHSDDVLDFNTEPDEPMNILNNLKEMVETAKRKSVELPHWPTFYYIAPLRIFEDVIEEELFNE